MWWVRLIDQAIHWDLVISRVIESIVADTTIKDFISGHNGNGVLAQYEASCPKERNYCGSFEKNWY